MAETAFSPRSGPRTRTLFVPLAPEATGVRVENRYADPQMWSGRYLEYSVGAIGTGVAVGDYDGDGRPDLLVVSKVESCRLFRNLGGWRFEDVTAQAGLLDRSGVWKQGASFVDVNSDGRLDLYVCRFGAPNFLYVNQGDGTFRDEAAARGLALVDASAMAAFCDYDRDGRLDVFVHTNLLDSTVRPNGQPNHLWHQGGDGKFVDVSAAAGIHGDSQTHSSTWWDYDDDGWPDLYVANDFAAPDLLYHNNRDGTFTDVLAQVVPHQPLTAMGADLGDVNNDGLVDLLVADMAATTHEADLRGMAESRARITHDPAPGSAPQYPRSALYLSTGTARVQEAAILAGVHATDWTWSVRLEDFDQDGRLDLHVTNGMNREQNNSDLIARMMGAESATERIRLMRDSPVLSQRHFAFRNRGELEFEEVGAAWGLDQTGVSFGAATGDFDGDGDLDLAYVSLEGGVTLLRNDNDHGHAVIFALRGTRSNCFGVGATVRIHTAAGVQVRQLVLARGYGSSSEPVLHFGTGAAEWADWVEVCWPSGTVQRLEHLAMDRRYTLTEPAAAAPNDKPGEPESTYRVARWDLPTRSATGDVEEPLAAPLQPVRFARPGPALAVARFDAAGAPELLLGGDGATPLQRIAIGPGGVGAVTPMPASADAVALPDGPMLVFDADGDGDDDLLVTKAGAILPIGAPGYQPSLWLNDGHGRLQLAPTGTLPELRLSAGAAVAADFDRDGDLDVFLGARVLPGAYPLPPGSVLLRNEGGRFVDVTDDLAPGLRTAGMVASALWSDVDGDEWVDLLLALDWGGVRYWHNRQGPGFEDRSETAGFAAAGTGWWTGIAAADFNGDGQCDYVVGNFGLNTPYGRGGDRPAELFLGHFGSGTGSRILEAVHEGGQLYPLRSRKELAKVVPGLLKRYPQNDAFARATLAEVAGDVRLGRAHRFTTNEFRSGVFLSSGPGRFRFQPLPRIAQISPLQGIVAGDFDGDGRADIVAVQNVFATLPATGRLDGGLGQFLRGDGLGGWAAVPGRESGVLVPGDAKALIAIDADDNGSPDLVVSRNGDRALLLQQQAAANRRFRRVTLRGAAGNLHAIGARVTAEYQDGTRLTAEVAAGSGFLSQSGPDCFFGDPERNPLRRIVVRWPTGGVTTCDAPPGRSRLYLAAPDGER